MFKRIFGFSALAVLLFTSCNSNSCYETMDVKVYCSMYSLSLKKAVSIDSITVWGVGSDSVIYDNAKVEKLAFELNPKASETQYVVQAVGSGHTYTDTISLYHTNQPWFQSMECGCMVFSTLDSIKTKGVIFQSAIILDPKIINAETEHVTLNI